MDPNIRHRNYGHTSLEMGARHVSIKEIARHLNIGELWTAVGNWRHGNMKVMLGAIRRQVLSGSVFDVILSNVRSEMLWVTARRRGLSECDGRRYKKLSHKRFLTQRRLNRATLKRIARIVR